jgi:hypothetical protein
VDGDDLRELELAIDTHGALSGEDSQRLITQVRRLLEENRGLRVLLKSPYQGEYAYLSDAAIDAALTERDPAHER